MNLNLGIVGKVTYSKLWLWLWGAAVLQPIAGKTMVAISNLWLLDVMVLLYALHTCRSLMSVRNEDVVNLVVYRYTWAVD